MIAAWFTSSEISTISLSVCPTVRQIQERIGHITSDFLVKEQHIVDSTKSCGIIEIQSSIRFHTSDHYYMGQTIPITRCPQWTMFPEEFCKRSPTIGLIDDRNCFQT